MTNHCVIVDASRLPARPWLRGLGLALGLCAAVGCGGPAPLDKPALDPQQAAAAAIAEADQDGDGALSEAELKIYPALVRVRGRYDKDGDGLIQAQEIADQLQVWRDRGAAIRSLSCRVTLDGRPLPGANVAFEPEPFMGPEILASSGVSDETGLAVMSLPKEALPADLQNFQGIHLGLYRVRITHPDIDLPSQYNEQTTLGEEVGPTTVELNFALRRR